MELMIAVGIIGLLAGISIPSFVRARANSQTSACINNLRQIDGAVQQWALENNKSGASPVTKSEVSKYVGRPVPGVWPRCPADGDYELTNVNEKPTCTLAGIGHLLED